MSSVKKVIIPPIMLMILIFILSCIPIDKIICETKDNLGALIFLKSKIQNLLNIEISFSIIQNFLHIPFFALLAFLWMKFFSKRDIVFAKAAIYSLAITLLFSIFGELCQLFIQRDASFLDLSLDFVGCLSGIGIYRLLNV